MNNIKLNTVFAIWQKGIWIKDTGTYNFFTTN